MDYLKIFALRARSIIKINPSMQALAISQYWILLTLITPVWPARRVIFGSSKTEESGSEIISISSSPLGKSRGSS